MSDHPCWHRALPLCLIIGALWAAFPTVSEAAKAGGGTTTTMTLTYVNGVQKWVMRIDPLNVQSFQLDVMFDPNRCQLDQAVGTNGVIYKFPFSQGPIAPILSTGRVEDIQGTTATTSPGDVDIFELVFTDLQPGTPISGVLFTVFASSNDFIVGLDPATMQQVMFDFTQIASTTRSVTPGVAPHVWDPDTVYNNGNTGGPGTWDTSSHSWDDLPLPSQTPSDTAWDNVTHAHDIAAFGGNPGTGIVTVSGAISAGGFQFDNSGYIIYGGTITLSAPAGLNPTIDTGANNAIISSTISGNGLTKVGTGTLALTGANNYTGGTFVNGGTLLVSNSAGSGTGNGDVQVTNSGSTVGGAGAIAGPVTVNTGAVVLGGNGTMAGGTLTIVNNLLLNTGSIISLALGPDGAHSSLNRAGGTWDFAGNQAFTFIYLDAQPGFYSNIVTGLASDPGVGSWTITNPGVSGTFTFDAAGNVDLQLAVVPSGLVGIESNGGGIAVTFRALAGKSYRLERRVAITDSTWNAISDLDDLKAGATGPAQITDPNAVNLAKAFYRVHLVP